MAQSRRTPDSDGDTDSTATASDKVVNGFAPEGGEVAVGDAAQCKRALEEGLPYQTLIASLLHKYASRTASGSLAVRELRS